MQKRKWQVAEVVGYALLKENAKENRKAMTDAESAFWSVAKSSGLGEKCRRQYVIGQYIVDFFFRKSMLVVEIDGSYHFTAQQQEYDATRQEYLEQKGYKVLRFTNEQVISNLPQVIETVKNSLKAIAYSPYNGD